MSGQSDDWPCHKCGGLLQVYTEEREYPVASSMCLNCGFYSYTGTGRDTLAGVNADRVERELRPLKKLRKQRKKA